MENIFFTLNENEQYLKKQFSSGKELVIRRFFIKDIECMIAYVLGLNNVQNISNFILKPAMEYSGEIDKNKGVLDEIINKVCIVTEVVQEDSYSTIITELMKGKCALFVNNEAKALLLAVDEFKERGISEPPTSAVLKGPRSGFVENLKTNVSCIRKILGTSKLRSDILTVGRYTNTQVAILYIEGIVDKNVVDKVKRKIAKIDIDGIIDSYYITSFLEEHTDSIFKQVGSVEKPDIASAKLLEGRVAIVIDGSPIVLTVPFLLIEDLQNSDDYYSVHSRATMLRILRLIGLFITLLLPGTYIAIVLHHYKAIPLKFLITIINTTSGLPLTPFAEILFVLILFEILYEASLRMPSYLGLALSIVGALILGDTAVKAGLISPPSVMLVAVSGMTLYTIPEQSPQLSILRLVFTLAGGFLGLFGVVALFIYFLFYLNDFDSYGAPYLAPLAPFVKNDIKDSVYKVDIVHMKTRPRSFGGKNKIRLRHNDKNNK